MFSLDFAVGGCWRAVTWCSGFSLGRGYKSLGCHAFALICLSSFIMKTTESTRQTDMERFKGWQQHHGLEVLSLLLTVLQRAWRQRTDFSRASISFFFLWWTQIVSRWSCYHQNPNELSQICLLIWCPPGEPLMLSQATCRYAWWIRSQAHTLTDMRRHPWLALNTYHLQAGREC